MRKCKKSKKKVQVPTHWSKLAIVGICMALILFATGIVVWKYSPIKSVDIFVVHPLVATPVPTPFVPTEVVPVDTTPIPATDPVVEEEIPTNYPNSFEDTLATTPTAKPGFIAQSMLGWKIIFNVIKSPFIK